MLTALAATRPDLPRTAIATILAMTFAWPLAMAPSMAAERPLAELPLAELPLPVIRVTGEGTASIRPDLAIISFAVLREAQTASQALDANNQAMAAVVAAMKQAGIADRDLQTSSFSIEPRYVYPKNNDGTQQPQIVGYVVSNQLTIRVRELSKIGELLDQVVRLGVNSGGTITFSNDNPEAAIEQARAAAMRDARKKATTLVTAAGASLGPILEISENAAMPQPTPIARGRMMAEAVLADSVPVEAGENSYRVTVQAAWQISQ